MGEQVCSLNQDLSTNLAWFYPKTVPAHHKPSTGLLRRCKNERQELLSILPGREQQEELHHEEGQARTPTNSNGVAPG